MADRAIPVANPEVRFYRAQEDGTKEGGDQTEGAPVGRERLRRVLRNLAFALGAVLLGELLFHLVIAPAVRVREIRVDVDVAIDEAQVAAAIGGGAGMSFFYADTAEIASRLRAIPEVASVSVRKRFPATLDVSIVGRRPVAVLLVEERGITRPVVCDGEAFAFRAPRFPEDASLPVVSGVRVENYRHGILLPGEAHFVFEQLRALRLEAPDLSGVVSEVRIRPARMVGYELELYLVSVPIPILIGDRITADDVRRAVRMTELLRTEGILQNTEKLDLRGTHVVYTTREG